MTEGEAPEVRRVGRKRDPGLDRRVLEATRAMVAASGVRGSSVSGIAQSARVGKPSVYLRWRNLTEILVAAIRDLHTPLEHLEGGSPEESLALAFDDDHGHLVRGPHLHFLSAVLYAGSYTPEIGRELWESILGPRHGRFVGILRSDPVLAGAGPERLAVAADLLQARILRDLALRSTHPVPELSAKTASIVRGIATA